jgi:hypothetical protein
MEKVLVLNQDFKPLNVTTVRRGFNLVFKGKAEIIYSDEKKPIVSSVTKYRRPTIIRLFRYIYLPFKKVPLSRHSIYRRDSYNCVYCGSNRDLTLDHVLPKSRGGKNTWKNLVTSCFDCNVTKGNRTPPEAGMSMSIKPYTPTYMEFIEKMCGNIKEEWKTYLLL